MSETECGVFEDDSVTFNQFVNDPKKSQLNKQTVKYVIINIDQIDQNEIRYLENKFRNIESKSNLICKIDTHSSLKLDQIRSIFNEEIYNSKTVDYSYLVFCIFASFTIDENSNKSFMCADNNIVRIKKLPLFFNKLSIPVYFLINERKKIENLPKNKFHMVYQTSNVYISFNTFPNSWQIERLCASFKKAKVEQCDNNACQIFTQLIDDLHSGLNSQIEKIFSETIFSISTNTCRPIEHSISKNEAVYDFHNPSNGMCVILNFKINQENLEQCGSSTETVEMLTNTFQELGFRVNLFDQFDFGKTIKLIENFDHSGSNSFVLCLITHFNGADLYSNGDKVFKLQNLIKITNPTLLKIPKFLFIYNPYKNVQNPIISHSIDALRIMIDIPENYLIAYMAYKKAQNLDNPNLVEILCQIMKNYHSKYDMFTLIQMAALKTRKFLKSDNDENSLSNVFVKSTLNKLYFVFNESKVKFPINQSIEKLNLPIMQYRTFPEENVNSLFYLIKKGKCLLFQYTDNGQSNDMIDRNIKSLIKTFKNLKFDVELLQDKSFFHSSIIGDNEKRLKAYDCIVVFIFLNGTSKIDTDRDKLFNYLSNDCLVEKPKLFFVLGTDKIENSDSDTAENLPKKKPKITKSIKIPKYSNFLYYYSNEIPQTVNNLCSELDKDYYDLSSVLSNVMKKVRKNAGNNEIICYWNSTLTQLVSFNQIKNSKICPHKAICSYKKGICYIFDYEIFKDDNGKILEDKTRLGSEFDVKRIEGFFGTLNFETVTKFNLTKAETLRNLNEIYSKDFSSYGCIVMCFLSHGNDGGVLRCSKNTINLDELINTVASKSKNNVIPKIFLIQTCQGGIVHPDKMTIVDLTTVEGAKTPENKTQQWNYPNLLVFTATYPGWASFRESTTGSYFIQSLFKLLEDNYKVRDLVSIFAMVCKMVGYFVEIEYGPEQNGQKQNLKQIPFLHSTMTKQFKLVKLTNSDTIL